jgi:Calcineurin-like phosphoesterase
MRSRPLGARGLLLCLSAGVFAATSCAGGSTSTLLGTSARTATSTVEDSPATAVSTSTPAITRASHRSSRGGAARSGSVGPSGGSVDALHFVVVGDTRPPVVDDTSAYPTAVITRIWEDIESLSPRPDFAISTGDYMFASTTRGQASPQLDLYLQARERFSNIAFPAMGNHECTGATASNCGPGTADGVTDNYTQFLDKLLAPLGIVTPYYVIHVGSTSHAWTAKFVFIAANAWTEAQRSWLASTLAEPTTYTFVVRHEPIAADTAPGVIPSEHIIRQHPLTLRIVGHTHTFRYHPGSEIVVGNGGAPLSGSVGYGYVIARQRSDGAIVFTEYDYATNAANQTFAVQADGTPTD